MGYREFVTNCNNGIIGRLPLVLRSLSVDTKGTGSDLLICSFVLWMDANKGEKKQLLGVRFASYVYIIIPRWNTPAVWKMVMCAGPLKEM